MGVSTTELQKATIWYSIANHGGTASLEFYIDEKDAQEAQKEAFEKGYGWEESCYGSIETYVGSSQYNEALNRLTNSETNTTLG